MMLPTLSEWSPGLLFIEIEGVQMPARKASGIRWVLPIWRYTVRLEIACPDIFSNSHFNCSLPLNTNPSGSMVIDGPHIHYSNPISHGVIVIYQE
jgi:hypothetical protein